MVFISRFCFVVVFFLILSFIPGSSSKFIYWNSFYLSITFLLILCIIYSNMWKVYTRKLYCLLSLLLLCFWEVINAEEEDVLQKRSSALTRSFQKLFVHWSGSFKDFLNDSLYFTNLTCELRLYRESLLLFIFGEFSNMERFLWMGVRMIVCNLSRKVLILKLKLKTKGKKMNGWIEINIFWRRNYPYMFNLITKPNHYHYYGCYRYHHLHVSYYGCLFYQCFPSLIFFYKFQRLLWRTPMPTIGVYPCKSIWWKTSHKPRHSHRWSSDHEFLWQHVLYGTWLCRH